MGSRVIVNFGSMVYCNINIYCHSTDIEVETRQHYHKRTLYYHTHQNLLYDPSIPDTHPRDHHAHSASIYNILLDFDFVKIQGSRGTDVSYRDCLPVFRVSSSTPHYHLPTICLSDTIRCQAVCCLDLVGWCICSIFTGRYFTLPGCAVTSNRRKKRRWRGMGESSPRSCERYSRDCRPCISSCR